ncbi:MAG: DUF1015 domain-containing protein [Oscillospiraceae bacterium]
MFCFQPADILLPDGVDLNKWSVIACDQFTAQPEYWVETERIVGGSPSALRLVLPEAYLDSPDAEKRIEEINGTMRLYLEAGYFRTLEHAMILVQRTLSSGKTRSGLIGRVDLEQYDYNSGADSLVRATEGTVLKRLPPRVSVRENAPVELPHILLLMDDPDMTVIEPVCKQRHKLKKEYDFELMQGGGHITGYSIPRGMQPSVLEALRKLADQSAFEKKYGLYDKPVLLFASGDGNHSLAAAKQCWENLKKSLSKAERETHPARWALVELVNLHDESLEFEAIHRVVFDIDPEALLEALRRKYPSAGDGSDKAGHSFGFQYSGKSGRITLEGITQGLPVGCLQDFLDVYVAENGGRIDYVHGEDVARELGNRPRNIAFLLEPMRKDELFKAVITGGALPRKTFSMGEARDKRYYLEARAIR